ncbi:MAG: hypothetical protein H7249_01310 [Chitinophagaceae bacterium]|nr:hypothetical protein [Oligoflexus sp.]
MPKNSKLHFNLSTLLAAGLIAGCSVAPEPYKFSNKAGANAEGVVVNDDGTTSPGSSSASHSVAGSPTPAGGSPSGSSSPTSTVMTPSTGGGLNVAVPSSRGYQNIPWEEIQAENATLGGAAAKIGPSRVKWDINHIEAEAIGRMAVRLDKTGDSVTFKPTKAGNSIVVRLSIPDSPNGGGIDSTLGVYINGTRVKSLPVTSKYSWSYNGGEIGNPKVDDPRINSKFPHTFFDEARMLLPEFPAGAEIKLQRDAQDNAAFYIIDLADFEKVAPPLTIPEGYVSVEVASGGAIKPNDGKDHGDDLIALMSTNIGKKIFFPAGVYLAKTYASHASNAGIDNFGSEIRGAGMWYTELRGSKMIWFCHGSSTKCDYADFSLYGESVARAEEIDGVQKAFAGPLGANSTINNIWIEHTVGAIWVGNDPPYQDAPTTGLTIKNCRIRNTYADGINFDNGTNNSSVENCHMRNTGDDAAVVWSVKWTDWVKEKSYQAGPNFIKPDGKNAPDQGVGHGNIMHHISVQMPWRANCFAAYGGYDNVWSDNTCEDVLTYPGILIDNEFSPYPFSAGPNNDKPTTFRNISLIRAGGQMFLEPTPWEHGALKLYQREGSVNDILIDTIDIIDPTYSGIEFKGFGNKYIPSGEKFDPDMVHDAENAKFKNVILRNINILNAGTYGIEVGDAGGQGEVTFDNVKVTTPAKGGLLNKDNNAPASFFIKKNNNIGW